MILEAGSSALEWEEEEEEEVEHLKGRKQQCVAMISKTA